jgi:hypothetical protein
MLAAASSPWNKAGCTKGGVRRLDLATNRGETSIPPDRRADGRAGLRPVLYEQRWLEGIGSK